MPEGPPYKIRARVVDLVVIRIEGLLEMLETNGMVLSSQKGG